MKSFFVIFVLSFSASAFAIPCEEAALNQALREYINKQPMCFSPCESAKVQKKFYDYGMELLAQNCPTDDATVITLKNQLSEMGHESEVAIEATCH
ncbi:MAG TPA: hypothetical protein VF412_01845 [Bdellovibrio sp.]|uniref:hypothetical protein n=1 Tax=Bdellovibrio sp. TaxID=28201 RepID=UPI002EEE7BEF